MKISTNCKQAVRHTCHQMPLTHYSSWQDRNENWNTYWHGDKQSNEVGCQCSIRNNCQGTDTFDLIDCWRPSTSRNSLILVSARRFCHQLSPILSKYPN